MNNMMKLLATAFFCGSLFVSPLLASAWEFEYQLTSDGEYKTAQVNVPASCTVWVTVEAIPGPGTWVSTYDPLSEMTNWAYQPGWAFAEAAVSGPDYSHWEIDNAGGGSDYFEQSGNPTAGIYTVNAVGHVSEGGQVLVRVGIDW
ncbi:hypothetical protein DB347_11725 [Opitutaceae bacterium EW11]|nr:hypothetical protein DB347_11725 [Opitutaceae bacterium EW11]